MLGYPLLMDIFVEYIVWTSCGIHSVDIFVKYIVWTSCGIHSVDILWNT